MRGAAHWPHAERFEARSAVPPPPPHRQTSRTEPTIGRAAIQQGYRVIYREAHTFLEELAEATLADTRKALLDELTRVPLLIIDDLGMRKLPHTAAEDLLELIMRRYDNANSRPRCRAASARSICCPSRRYAALSNRALSAFVARAMRHKHITA